MKDTIERGKKAIGPEKVFTTHISDNGLAFRIYKEHPQTNNNNKKKANHPTRRGKSLNRHFTV